jgi:hypothetical protein
MPVDVLEADSARIARNGADRTAPRRVDAQGLNFDLIAKALQRDDPLRRSYLRRRWQGQCALVPLSRDQGCILARAPLSLILLDRR